MSHGLVEGDETDMGPKVRTRPRTMITRGPVTANPLISGRVSTASDDEESVPR